MRFLTGKVHVPLQAGNAPEILAFQEGGLRVPEDFQHQLVLSGPQIGRDAEAGQVFGILTVAHFPAVYVYISAAFAAAEVQVHLPALPLFRHGESPVIQGGGKMLRQHAGHRILGAEIVGDIGVDGRAVSLYLPVARHLDGVPLGRLVVLGQLVPVFVVLEIPHTVQATVVFAFPEAFGEGIGPRGVIHHFRPARFRVHGGGLDVLPVRKDG